MKLIIDPIENITNHDNWDFEYNKRKFDIDNNKWVEIKTYKELKRKFYNENWKIKWKRKNIETFLENVKRITWKDPVKYLYELYESWLSVKIIWERFWYKEYNLFYLFNSIFNWELRDCNERTESWIKRREKNKDVEWLKTQRLKNHIKAQEKYKKSVNTIIGWYSIENKKVDLEYFNKLNWKLRKIIYVLSISFNKSIESTIDIIKSLKDLWIWWNTISDNILCNLESFFKENHDFIIDIKADDIYYIWGKYDYDKYKKEEFFQEELWDIDETIEIWNFFKLNHRLSTVIWITSRKELEELQKNTRESNKRKLTNRLDGLSLALKKIYKNNSIDPIKFLVHLYYEKWYSMQEVSDYLKNMWIDWPRSSLENQKKLFWWEVNKKK